jgi:sulfide:quinone oxidoreductase
VRVAAARSLKLDANCGKAEAATGVRTDVAPVRRAYGAAMTPATSHRVLIAGGGVGGLEAMLALHDLAGDHVSMTLLTPEDAFSVRALSVEDPFGGPAVRRYDLEPICAEAGADLVRDELVSVDPRGQTVTTATGATLPYDDLVVAVGARHRPAFASGIPFHGLDEAEAVHGLIQDVEIGAVGSIAFVVPSGVTWPLPLYELALLTAERAHAMGVDPTCSIVTAEERPLGIFGPQASDAVATLLRDAGIEVHTSTHVRDVDRGIVLGLDGEPAVTAQRVVTLPALAGPAVPGLPADRDGFIPTDDHGRVHDTPAVWAVGDGTTFPLKQGGIAAQQAVAVAETIAAATGAPVTPQPFRPRLRAKLITGARPRYLSEIVVGGAGNESSTASEEPLWWPPTKIAAAHLGAYLDRATAP